MQKKFPSGVDHWLSLVGLSAEHKSRYPMSFQVVKDSGIGIARALILEPDLLSATNLFRPLMYPSKPKWLTY